MSAISSVSLPNYAEAVSNASAPGGKPPSDGKPKPDYTIDGATTLTLNATQPDKVSILA